MDREFWLQKWHNNETGFHEEDANPNLVTHFPALNLQPNQRVFLPLCGKTLDISWLISCGYEVVGAELSGIAIQQLFEQLDVIPHTTKLGEITRYESHGVTVFGGDIFHLTGEMLGPIDAIYDRAALVALPPAMRTGYTEHLRTITQCAPQLLITFHYDQAVLPGPPFSVPDREVEQHYQNHYHLACLSSHPINLKGKVPAHEQVWQLTPK
ncbi:thiopurine S-methyltransferase [Alteromonas sp. C1M14]|uniref:thiopurine S-methyltransferase n=1 Tax=Alteromonas sp. C1M14 TaxID=2841567 RepID=UPI001C083C44|nr:thiopurine S-methyltransferase [Alteromonas sp. C1M14]MBU2977611.1 thiopurine S-methyltransferase [Alteromonas sp. C1M14]